MGKTMKKWLALLLAAVMTLSLAACGGQEEKPEPAAPQELDAPQELTPPPALTGDPLQDTAALLQSMLPEPVVGSLTGDWVIMSLCRGGLEVPQDYLEGYYDRSVEAVQACDGVLDARKYTEFSRFILALTAMGKDPADVGGYNLLEPLGDFDQTVFQGINGAIFALIALDSGHYEVPVREDVETQGSREAYVDFLLESLTSDGGWSLAGDAAEVDLTAMALQALAPYREQPEVQAAVEQGVDFLSRKQLPTGGFGFEDSESCESICQTILALTALGIDPADPRFVKEDNTLESHLLEFYVEGEGFAHAPGTEANLMATEQAFQALVALDRFEKGQTSFYDMAGTEAAQ